MSVDYIFICYIDKLSGWFLSAFLVYCEKGDSSIWAVFTEINIDYNSSYGIVYFSISELFFYRYHDILVSFR